MDDRQSVFHQYENLKLTSAVVAFEECLLRKWTRDVQLKMKTRLRNSLFREGLLSKLAEYTTCKYNENIILRAKLFKAKKKFKLYLVS